MRSVGALWAAPVCVPNSNLAKVTLKTESIETGTRTLELPLLVRSGDLFSPPSPKKEILNAPAPVSVFQVINIRRKVQKSRSVTRVCVA